MRTLTVFSRVIAALAFIGFEPVHAQNIVVPEAAPALERRDLSADDIALLDTPLPKWPKKTDFPVPELSFRAAEFVRDWPWRPFFHQLGISGAETHFAHPDEMFHALSIALPFIERSKAEEVIEFLAARLAEKPPYVVEGYAPNVGTARERYDVPEKLRRKDAVNARDAWGVYAFLEYVTATEDQAAVEKHWPAIRQRMAPLLEKEYTFDPKSTAYRHDEAECLNGNLAGLYATLHLARAMKDEATATMARAQAAKLMQLRLDLERVNPKFMEPTDSSTKSLHHFKLARYLHLPEPMLVLLRHDQTVAKRIQPFREARPGWWMAFGDRFIGGENYTNSPDFARALFIAAAELEPCPPEMTIKWLDVPWCRGDLYYLERLALFLRSAAGK